jgi:hypothetical protein
MMKKNSAKESIHRIHSLSLLKMIVLDIQAVVFLLQRQHQRIFFLSDDRSIDGRKVLNVCRSRRRMKEELIENAERGEMEEICWCNESLTLLWWSWRLNDTGRFVAAGAFSRAASRADFSLQWSSWKQYLVLQI